MSSGHFDQLDVAWGESDSMTEFEAMMWRAEADELLRSDGVVLELLDGTPSWERLVEGHEWAVRRMPRLRQRVLDDPLHVGPPAWVAVEVDLDWHLRRIELPAGSTIGDVFPFAAELHASAFDPSKPLWRATLVEGLAGGQSAYLLKLHHAYADGTGIVQMLDLLHSDRSEATPGKPDLPAPAGENGSALDVIVRNSTRGARDGGRAGLRIGRELIGAAARLIRAPVSETGAAIEYARSLARVVGDSPGTQSTAMRARGGPRRVWAIDLPVSELSAAGKSAGGSLNDAFLAALAGGLGRYHAQLGVEVGDLPVGMPISLRAATDEVGGNKFAGARIALPAGEPDPATRIRLIRERVLAARDEPAIDFMSLTSPLVSRVPAVVLTRLTASFTRSLDLQASNFRGLDRPAYIAGVRILRMYPFGPVPGCGVMATLISHEGQCCIGVTIDTAAVTAPEALEAALTQAFDEIRALAPSVSS